MLCRLFLGRLACRVGVYPVIMDLLRISFVLSVGNSCDFCLFFLLVLRGLVPLLRGLFMWLLLELLILRF